MRIPVSKSDLQSGPIQKISKCLARAWPIPLKYLEATDKVAQLFGYRNLYEMQQLAVDTLDSRSDVADLRMVLLGAVMRTENLPLASITEIVNSLPLNLLSATKVVPLFSDVFLHPGTMAVFEYLLIELYESAESGESKTTKSLHVNDILGGLNFSIEREELGEILMALTQTPIRYQADKSRSATFRLLTQFSFQDPSSEYSDDDGDEDAEIVQYVISPELFRLCGVDSELGFDAEGCSPERIMNLLRKISNSRSGTP
jgi:hypothetical protein